MQRLPTVRACRWHLPRQPPQPPPAQAGDGFTTTAPFTANPTHSILATCGHVCQLPSHWSKPQELWASPYSAGMSDLQPNKVLGRERWRTGHPSPPRTCSWSAARTSAAERSVWRRNVCARKELQTFSNSGRICKQLAHKVPPHFWYASFRLTPPSGSKMTVASGIYWQSLTDVINTIQHALWNKHFISIRLLCWLHILDFSKVFYLAVCCKISRYGSLRRQMWYE